MGRSEYKMDTFSNTRGSNRIEIFDNFLSHFTHQRISETLLDNRNFPYYYHSYVVLKTDDEINDVDQVLFGHGLYNDREIKSHYFHTIGLPFIDKLEIDEGNLLRIKINMNLNHGKHVFSDYHVDYSHSIINEEDKPFNFKTAIYYVNTNNGYTEFETGEKVESVANRLVVFDGTIKHRGVTQTDTKCRSVININYV